MFASFDTGDTGMISLEEFLCGLAVLKHGTQEERILFLFHVLDGNRDGYITQRDVTELAAVLDKAGGRVLDPKATWLEMIAPKVTEEENRIDSRRFGAWAGDHRVSPLVRWIFEVEHKLTSVCAQQRARRVANTLPPSLPPCLSLACLPCLG